MHAKHSLFDGIPRALAEEWSQRLAGNDHARVDRIVSRGHASPPDFWYEQAQTEWVMVVAGSARLRFDDGTVLELNAGDHVTIAPHARHRVDATAPDQDTIWLAVFF